MTLGQAALLGAVRDEWMPAFLAEKDRLDRIDQWLRWDPEKPHRPQQATKEYDELADRSTTPWLMHVVTTVAQTLYVEGYRRSREGDNAPGWKYWQANGLDKRQLAIHRAALGYGLTYTTVLPGQILDGTPVPVIRGISPRRMIAFYADPAEDDWPLIALRADPAKVDNAMGWALRVYDDGEVHYLNADALGRKIDYIDTKTHGVGVCPVVRHTNMLDLEGRCDGEVEPYIAIAARLNQDVFDRLVIQRFAAWVVRTIAGMTKNEVAGEDADPRKAKLELKAEDILVAEDPDTKFGSLPASDLKGVIEGHDTDLRDLAAVTQTPPHDLLGQMANLSAEALNAAEAGRERKTLERKHSLGETHEQTLRLAAHVDGDKAGAADFGAEVRWADIESRSLAAVADALGKLAESLKIPPEELWEEIPGVTDQQIQRWKAAAEKGGVLEQMMLALGNKETPADPSPPAPAAAT